MAKMSEIKSNTWTKVCEVKTDDLSLDNIARLYFNEFDFWVDCTFDYIRYVEVPNMIKSGYIELCDDGFIVWMS